MFVLVILTEMYADRFACCPPVNHVVYVPRALLMFAQVIAKNVGSVLRHSVCPYLAPFLRYSEILVQNCRFNLPHLYLVLPLGVIPLEFR